MSGWTDSHNHLQDPRLGPPETVISAMKTAGVTRCIVNATSEADWPAVEALALAHPGFILPAFGIHPWKAHTATDGWQDRLSGILERHPQASIGECGLDYWVSCPPIGIQMPVFEAQLGLAHGLGRPITIHCLRAWGLLLEVMARGVMPPGFLMHSFGGTIEVARRLIPMGARFSLSGHALHPRKAGLLEVFRQLPIERIMVETDAPDMAPPADFTSHPMAGDCNHPANLPVIGAALATALGMTAVELARITRENAAALFPPAGG